MVGGGCGWFKLGGCWSPIRFTFRDVGLVCGLVCGLVESIELNFFMILGGSFLLTGGVITVIQGSLGGGVGFTVWVGGSWSPIILENLVRVDFGSLFSSLVFL